MKHYKSPGINGTTERGVLLDIDRKMIKRVFPWETITMWFHERINERTAIKKKK